MQKNDFIEISKCKNCVLFNNGCEQGNSRGGVGSDNPDGTCINFELVEEKELQKRADIQNIEIEKNVLEKLRNEVNQQLALKLRQEATELIVDQIKKDNYIYTTKDDVKSEMWIYQEGIYKPNGKSYVKEYSRLVLAEAYTINLANDVLNKIETDTYINQEDFFQNNYVDEIPVINGILNVRTRKLSDFNPKKIFFNKIPISYNKDSTAESIDKFISDIVATEEDKTVAYELIGAGLYKEYFTEKAGMLVGNGRNGKSKFLELIKRMVGVDNTCAVPLRAMKEDNSSLCELHNRLFNLAGDLSNTDLKDTGCFKQTVGRDILQAHRKFLRDLKFVNFAKHLFACNELPKVYDTTDGFWTKWVVLEFPYKFVSSKEYERTPKEMRDKLKIKDPEIIEKITTEHELSGLLNLALDGLDRLFKNKNFSQTKGTIEIKDFWIRNSDSFAAFCIDCIDEDYEGYITKKDLRKRYHRYCKGHKIKGAGDKAIKATLEDRYGVIESRKYINESQEHIWEGIKLRGNLIN